MPAVVVSTAIPSPFTNPETRTMRRPVLRESPSLVGNSESRTWRRGDSAETRSRQSTISHGRSRPRKSSRSRETGMPGKAWVTAHSAVAGESPTRTVLRICGQRQRNGHQGNQSPEPHGDYFTPDRRCMLSLKTMSLENQLRNSNRHTRQSSDRHPLMRSLICLRLRLCSSACLASSTTSSSPAKRSAIIWSSLSW